MGMFFCNFLRAYFHFGVVFFFGVVFIFEDVFLLDSSSFSGLPSFWVLSSILRSPSYFWVILIVFSSFWEHFHYCSRSHFLVKGPFRNENPVVKNEHPVYFSWYSTPCIAYLTFNTLYFLVDLQFSVYLSWYTSLCIFYYIAQARLQPKHTNCG